DIVKLGKHLFWYAADKDNVECGRRVVIQRDLLPDGVAEPVGQYQQQRICGVVVGADQLNMAGVGFVQQDEDVVGSHHRTAPRLAFDRGVNAFIVERDARVGDRVAVQEQPGRRGIDG